MDAFSITCTTCGRRLRVKDRRLVGQIVACPKCQAMVLIELPEKLEAAGIEMGGDGGAPADEESRGGTASTQRPPAAAGRLAIGEGDVDSEAVTEDGIPAAGTWAGGLSERMTRGWSGASEPPESPPPAGQLADSVGVGATGSSSDGAGVDGASLTPPQVDGAVPPVAWQSEAVARRRQIVGIAVLATVSLLVAVSVFGLVVRSWREGKQRQGVAQDGGPATSPREEATGIDSPADDAQEASPRETAETANSQPGESAATDLPTSSASAEPNIEGNPPNSVTDPSVTDPAVVEGGEPNKADPATGQVDSGGPTIGGPSVPDLPAPSLPAPGVGGVGEARSPVAGAEQGDAAAGPTELPPELAIYMRKFEDSNVARPDNAQAAAPTREDLLVRRPDLAARESEFPLPGAPIDVRGNLEKVRVKQLSAQQRPLDQLLREIAQLGGIPIQFDLQAMDLAGVRPDLPVTLQRQDLNGLGLLGETVQQAGCRVTLSEGVVTVIPGNAHQQPITLGDLQFDSPTLLGDLRSILGPAAKDAKLAIESGVLELEGPPEMRARAGLVIAALGRAQGVALDWGGAGLDRWIARWDQVEGGGVRAADWQPLPDVATGLNFDIPLAVELIIGNLARESDAALVVDWRAVWEHGFTPSETALPWLRNRKVPQIVGEMLEPFRLTALDAGHGVWWLGTQEAYESMPIVGVLRSPHDEATSRAMIAAAAGVDEGGVPAFLDEVSGKWIVVLPRYVVRELPSVLSQGAEAAVN